MATIKEKLDWAFENQGKDPMAKEYVNRYRKGLLNPELTKGGLNPVDIPKPKVDMSKIMAIPQKEGLKSTIPQPSTTKEMGGDVLETAQNIGTTISEGAENVQKIAGSDTLNPAQKAMGVLGSLMGTGARTIGDVTMGAGKALLTQDAEDQLKSFVQEKAQGIAETETAKKIADWYGNLTPENKLIVDSAGGFASLVSEILGAGTAGKMMAPIKEGVETAIETGIKSVPKIVEQTSDTVSDIFKTSQKSLEGKVQSAFEKGVKPNLQGYKTLGEAENYRKDIVNGAKTIERNKDSIQFMDDAGEVTTGRAPQSLQEFTESIDQTKKAIYKQYDDLATQAGENGVKIDTIKIANELDQVINNKALKLSNPEAVKYAEEVRSRFIKAGELDAKTAQDIIQNYNNSLKAFYRNPTPEGLTKNAVDALMANQMRQALDEGIEGLTGAQYQALKSQYASLKTIERDVLRATLRDARKNAKGLIDYTDIFSGGQLVSGLLTLNPSMIATGAAQKGISEWFKFLNDPNRAIKQMFEATSKLDQEAGSVPISTRKQLPAPAEGAADVSIYSPMELGARSPSTIDIQEGMNPNIKTTAKGYQSTGKIEIKGIDSEGNIAITDNGNVLVIPKEDLPVVKTPPKVYTKDQASFKKGENPKNYNSIPSKSNVDQSSPETSLPSEVTEVGTEGVSGLPNTTSYVRPSQFSDFDSISSYITTVRNEAQANLPTYEKEIVDKLGVKPDVRVKKAESLNGKIERTLLESRSPDEINDILGARIILKTNPTDTIAKIQKRFDVQKVKNYFEKKSLWGYRGANIVVRLKNGSLAEMQIHTPESLKIVDEIHPIYEKWRNKDIQKLTNNERIEMQKDIEKSNAISDALYKEY